MTDPTVIRVSRRAALNSKNASGNSASTAAMMLILASGVPESSMTSNQASQTSSVPVTIMEKMRICRWNQDAHAVSAKPISSAMSRPIQAPRQWVDVKCFGRVSARYTIQAASARQQPIVMMMPSCRRRTTRGSSSGCGRSIRARA